MGVAAGQTVVVDEDLQLAFTHGRIVEMRQEVDRCPSRVHRGLIDEVEVAQQRRIVNDLAWYGTEPFKEWRLGRAMGSGNGLDDGRDRCAASSRPARVRPGDREKCARFRNRFRSSSMYAGLISIFGRVNA